MLHKLLAKSPKMIRTVKDPQQAYMENLMKDLEKDKAAKPEPEEGSVEDDGEPEDEEEAGDEGEEEQPEPEEDVDLLIDHVDWQHA